MYSATSGSAAGRRKARGRNAVRIARAASSGVVPFPGRATRILARDLNSLNATSSANFAARRYFSARSGVRKSVSPALSKPSPPAPSAGSEAREVGLHVEEVANGCGIFFAIQAAHRRGSGRRSRGADCGANGGFGPGQERLAIGDGRGGDGLRRHLAVAHAENELIPPLGVREKGGRGRQVASGESAGGGRSLMAGLTMRFQEFLPAVKRELGWPGGQSDWDDENGETGPSHIWNSLSLSENSPSHTHAHGHKTLAYIR